MVELVEYWYDFDVLLDVVMLWIKVVYICYLNNLIGMMNMIDEFDCYFECVLKYVLIVVVGGGKLMVDDFVVYWVGEVFCVVFGVVGIFVVVIL